MYNKINNQPFPFNFYQNTPIDIFINKQVKQIYTKLNYQIDIMGRKVDGLIERNLDQFILAYKGCVKKIKGQLQGFRDRIEEQQRQIRSNQRGMFLEKETIILREQLLKVYEKVEQKSGECEHYKQLSKDMEKTIIILKKEIREIIKEKRNLQVTLLNTPDKSNQLQFTLNTNRDQQKSGRKERERVCGKSIDRENHKTLEGNTKGKSQSKSRCLIKSENKEQKRRSMFMTTVNKQNELQELFLDCIKLMKREISNRRRTNNHMKLDFNKIASLEQFRKVDKLQLLYKFIENESLVVFIYQKMFPKRGRQVRQFLSGRDRGTNRDRDGTEKVKCQIVSQRGKASSRAQNQIMVGFVDQMVDKNSKQIEVSLPQMINQNVSRKGANVIDKVSLKQGRLNLKYN